YSVLEWMRSGRWTMGVDHGEGTAEKPSWPRQPNWFTGPKDMHTIAQGLEDTGFSESDVAKIMGQNWLSFFEKSFTGKDRV
ncbi:MAG: membrane dipeptidase, partial [Porticoccaceae bacterium]